MSSRRACVVVDLGFGDAGKGLVTDYLVRSLGAHTVVRFNGGAQAGHNVVTPDGRHHTFSQFGAGTFVPGVRTHLSRQVIVHPTALLFEARHLEAVGVRAPLERLSVSREALVITPFHQAANRLREWARGEARHGSCGVGVGEAVRDSLASDDGLRMGALEDVKVLRPAARRIQARLREALDEVLRMLEPSDEVEAERRVLEDPATLERWIEELGPLLSSRVIVDDAALGELLSAEGAVIFEGAQGVLLDEWRGFHPHTTWSTCTFENALGLLDAHDFQGEVTRLGVLRTHAIRHGAGPFPTEAPELDVLLPEAHNGTGPWQGKVRLGFPDAVLLRYAIEVAGGVDGLALTHLDALDRVKDWKVCRAYRDGERRIDRLHASPGRDLAHQAALGELLGRVEPLYEALSATGAKQIDWVEEALGAKVRLTSSGPSARNVDARLPL